MPKSSKIKKRKMIEDMTRKMLRPYMLPQKDSGTFRAFLVY